MKFTSIPNILCLSLLCVFSNTRAETITLQDNFDSKTAEDGTPLDSLNVGTTQTAWEATPNAVLIKGSGLRAADDNPFVCRIALPSELKEVTVEADLSPNPAAKGWLSVGIGNGALANPNFGGLFFFVLPGGVYSLMLNPEPEDTRSLNAVVLKKGRLQSWNPDGMNSLKLVYNKEAGTVSAFANGNEEIVKDVSLKDKNLTLQPDFAGVSGIFEASETRSVGKFSATILK
ncbi:hypothetical protein BH09VER1_BH09VER1_39110 [soil metagenome]